MVVGPACGTAERHRTPVIVQPGAPGEPSRVIPPGEAIDLPQVRHTTADVRFMQAMIPHHAQALEMVELVPSRTTREDIRVLARRIELSQADEIRMMRRWLASRGEEVPDEHAHHADDESLMPGMLTAGDMRQLSESQGDMFARRFLAMMIRHHEGALAMVQALFAAGGGQEPEIFAFATEIESDQAVEIARMRGLLAP